MPRTEVPIKHSLSNSFPQPPTYRELLKLTHARGDAELARAFTDHAMAYTRLAVGHTILYCSDNIIRELLITS